MANWFHRFWNPHCSHCERELVNSKICTSCDILQGEVARLQRENEILLNRILEKPEPERTNSIEPTTQLRPKGAIPWTVRKQQLEAEDRVTAAAIKRAAKPDETVEALEKELDVVAEQREEKSGN